MKFQSIILGLFFFLAFSCRKEPFSWDTNWNLVVLHDTLNLQNLVVDSLLEVNPDESYQLVINRDLFNLSLEDVVSFPDTVIQENFNLPISALVPAGFQFIDQVENNDFDFQGVQLKNIIVGSGSVLVSVKSPIAGKCFVTIVLPGVTKNGQNFELEVEVPAGSLANPTVIVQELDMAGYAIDLRGSDGDFYNIIQSQFRVRTDPAGGSVQVNSSDVIQFEMAFSNMRPSYARGYFGSRIIQEQQTIDLDFMNLIVAGAIDLDQVDITMTIFNGIKVSARSKINSLSGESSSGNMVALNHPQIGPWILVNQAQGNWNNLQPFSHAINLSSGNSSIEPFLENLPKRMSIDFDFELNPWGNTSGSWDELFSTSKVRAFLTANMPLKIGINNLAIRDTFNLTLDNSGSISLKSGQIKLLCSNAYSFSANIQMQVLDENNDVLFTKTGAQPIAGSSSLSNISPIVAVNSEVVFDLNENETKLLNYMKKIVVTANFNSPNNGDVAQIYYGQFLAFRLYSNMKLLAKI